MCSTMHMFSDNRYVNIYTDLVDKSCFMDFDQNDLSFYPYYKSLGYENAKAKYWHHSEEPHRLYSEKLFDFWCKKYK